VVGVVAVGVVGGSMVVGLGAVGDIGSVGTTSLAHPLINIPTIKTTASSVTKTLRIFYSYFILLLLAQSFISLLHKHLLIFIGRRALPLSPIAPRAATGGAPTTHFTLVSPGRARH